jgi:hypothetical protein
MNKPTKEELKSWDKLLQKEGLGMDRGYNSTRLIYGHDYNRTNDGTTLAAAAVWIRKKRKEQNAPADKTAHTCAFCGAEFLAARTDATYCSAKCQKRQRRRPR